MAAALVLAAPGASGQPSRGEPLPLGPRGLPEERFEQQVAPGVRYTRIVRGESSPRDVYTVDVGFRAGRADADALAEELRADGHDPTVLRISERAADDPQRGPLGWLVRVGSFGSEAEAITLRDRLTAEGYAGTRVVYTGEDGGPTTGPWVVHVLEVDSRRSRTAFRPALDAELATGIVPERELLSGLAGRTGAVASLNGGYFVIGSADGTPGDLAGVSMLDGELVSESVGGRTSLLLTESGAQVAPVRTRLRARASDGAVREIDGLNRKPGLIRGCGGTGGDVPTELPKHDFTCTDASELILFTEAFGGDDRARRRGGGGARPARPRSRAQGRARRRHPVRRLRARRDRRRGRLAPKSRPARLEGGHPDLAARRRGHGHRERRPAPARQRQAVDQRLRRGLPLARESRSSSTASAYDGTRGRWRA